MIPSYQAESSPAFFEGWLRRYEWWSLPKSRTKKIASLKLDVDPWRPADLEYGILLKINFICSLIAFILQITHWPTCVNFCFNLKKTKTALRDEETQRYLFLLHNFL